MQSMVAYVITKWFRKLKEERILLPDGFLSLFRSQALHFATGYTHIRYGSIPAPLAITSCSPNHSVRLRTGATASITVSSFTRTSPTVAHRVQQ